MHPSPPSTKPTALVTGASRGIGRAIAQELARDHRLIATYKGRIDAAQSLAEATGADIVQCDSGSREDRERLVQHIASRYNGTLDLLVNNAGMAPGSGGICLRPPRRASTKSSPRT